MNAISCSNTLTMWILLFGCLVGFVAGDFDEPVELPRMERSSTNGVYDTRLTCSDGSKNKQIVATEPRILAAQKMLQEKSLDAIIVPSSDEHQSEYVAPADKRREFISGFSGSAGTAVVLAKSADIDRVLWTDSRYTVQADDQLDCKWKVVTTGRSNLTPTNWLKATLSAGAKVVADPRLFGSEEWKTMETSLAVSGIHLFEDTGIILDKIWEHNFHRPSHSNDPIFIHPIEFSGKTWQDKIKDVTKEMVKSNAQMMVVTALDEVAWLFNLRGNSIPHTPVFFSYAVIEMNGSTKVSLFINFPENTDNVIKKHLNVGNCMSMDMCVSVRPYDEVGDYVARKAQEDDVINVLMSKDHAYSTGASFFIYSKVPEGKRKLVLSPILLMKAEKTEIESSAMKQAQIRDSVVLIEFLSFLEREIKNGKVWTELSAADYLSKLRRKEKYARGESFEAISAFGSNGAIVHYEPSNQTNTRITKDSLFLLDSGGQYLDGTTDVTRTMHYGVPTKKQIQAYTLVAQGAIDLARQVFPNTMKDSFIDVIARRHLYQEGLDYGHGTGHGIGLFLSVHEGPTLVAMRQEGQLLKKGYFFSDEPGYYQRGEFGIRLESIVRVVESHVMDIGTNEPMLEFEVVTLVPLEPEMIDMTRLNAEQCEFLHKYNQNIRSTVGPLLLSRKSHSAYKWMLRKTPKLDCSFGYNSSSGVNSPGVFPICISCLYLFIILFKTYNW